MGHPAIQMPAPLGESAPREATERPASQLEQAGVAISLLVVSLLTTVSTGAVLMFNFRNGDPPFAANAGFFPLAWIWRHPDQFAGGWPFALTLLGILGAHEAGHYLACRFHGVRSSLPWVLPAPTLIGTFGAFIRLRSRVPSRTALMDIGVSGPLAGMVITLPVLIAGLLLSRPVAPAGFHSAASISVSVPLGLSILHGILRLFDPSLPPLDGAFNPHPILVAAWIGLFITSVNLIPAGQLDGGHILYALSPRVHRWITSAVIFLLFFAGTMLWVGWLVWGCFLLPSLRHPTVPRVPAQMGRRVWLAVAALALLLLTITPEPFAGGSLMNLLH
ncbi:MAG: site-2 protease family protein [Acidobacteriaceae bacterium]